MILLDKPYVSSFLQQTLEEHKIPVIATEFTNELLTENKYNFIQEDDAISKAKTTEGIALYTNSENSISWIERKLHFSSLPEKIKLFKNKIQFRNLLKDIFPTYKYKSIEYKQLESVDISDMPFPFIVKPAVGFFSIGVYKVESENDWKDAVEKIEKDLIQFKDVYPNEVLNTTEFILEECIEGDEFAVDCYFNETGEAVVLNILKHEFSSSSDVSDRVYSTSKDIIEEYKNSIEEFLQQVGELAKLKNFPAHVELRIDENGKINPIEVNPMRFGGWCTSADLAWFAFGHNIYENFFSKKKPDWNKLLKGKEDFIYSIVVFDNNTGYENDEIKSFDYDKAVGDFQNVLELRKTDHKKYSIFGFVFCETNKENTEELDRILRSNLREYITV